MFGQCLQYITTEFGLLLSLLLGGLVGGFTHCAGMCAPFVLAQCDSHNSRSHTTLSRLSGSALLPYHLGRMATYVGLSVLFYSAVNLAFLFSDTKIFITAPLLMLAGVLFLVSVFPVLLHMFPWAAKISAPAPLKTISRLSASLMKSPGPLKRFGLGVLLGFMPCGLVIAAIMAASTAPSIMHAGLAMSAFALGTIPALVLVTVGGSAIQTKFPNSKLWIRQGAMAISAVWLFVLAGTMML